MVMGWIWRSSPPICRHWHEAMGERYHCGADGISLINKPRGEWRKHVRQSKKFCEWCGRPVYTGKYPGKGARKATLDHIIPICWKGKDCQQNVKVSCGYCNEGRAATEHCIVSFICIKTIVGPSISQIAKYYGKSVRGELPPIAGRPERTLCHSRTLISIRGFSIPRLT